MGNGHKRVAVQREASALARQRQPRRSSGSAADSEICNGRLSGTPPGPPPGWGCLQPPSRIYAGDRSEPCSRRTGLPRLDMLIIGAGPAGSLRGLLRRFPRPGRWRDGLAARAGRPGLRAVPGEADLRRGRLPRHQGPGPGGRARLNRPPPRIRRTCWAIGPRT